MNVSGVMVKQWIVFHENIRWERLVANGNQWCKAQKWILTIIQFGEKGPKYRGGKREARWSAMIYIILVLSSPALLFFRKSLGWWFNRLNGVYGIPYFHPFSTHTQTTHTRIAYFLSGINKSLPTIYDAPIWKTPKKFICLHIWYLSQILWSSSILSPLFGNFLHMLPQRSEQIIELEKTLSLLVNILWWQLFRLCQEYEIECSLWIGIHFCMCQAPSFILPHLLFPRADGYFGLNRQFRLYFSEASPPGYFEFLLLFFQIIWF